MMYEEEFPMYYITQDVIAPLKGYDYLNDDYYSDYIDKIKVKELVMTGDEPIDRLKDILKYKNIEILHLHPKNCNKMNKYIRQLKNLKRIDACNCRLDDWFIRLLNNKNIEYFFINSKINGLRRNALYLDNDLNDRIISYHECASYSLSFIGTIKFITTVINDVTKPKIFIQNSYLYNYGQNEINSIVIRLDHLEEDLWMFDDCIKREIIGFCIRRKNEISNIYKKFNNEVSHSLNPIYFLEEEYYKERGWS